MIRSRRGGRGLRLLVGAVAASTGGVLGGCVRTRTEIVPALVAPALPAGAVPVPPSARCDASAPTAISMRRVDFT